MQDIDQHNLADEIKPPVTQVGVLGWIRTNLFKGLVKLLPDHHNSLFALENYPTRVSLGVC